MNDDDSYYRLVNQLLGDAEQAMKAADKLHRHAQIVLGLCYVFFFVWAGLLLDEMF